jgi:hypothetical protein
MVLVLLFIGSMFKVVGNFEVLLFNSQETLVEMTASWGFGQLCFSHPFRVLHASSSPVILKINF